MRGRSSDRPAPPDAPESPRATTFIYLVALLIIASISLTSHFLTNRIVARQESTALLVNTAGRQRMLSQRIARIAVEVADGSIDAPTGQAEIRALAGRMETAKTQLTYGDVTRGIPAATSPRLRAIYFDQPVHLEQQVNRFLAHARSFAGKQQPSLNDPDLKALIVAVTAPLLNSLDAAVSEYQSESEHDVRHLRHVMNTLTAVMLIVLVLEALLIYRPLFNRLTSAIAMLVKASTTDFLTGVMNRRAFLACAERELARAERLEHPVSLLVADLDHFKQINDTYGHPTGDLVIRHFAAVAQANLRTGDSLGRLGGEEFAILMPGTTLAGAQQAAERIRERFSATTAAVTPHAQRVLATTSMGVTCAQGGTVADLLAEADTMLYRAKKGGRNRVEAGFAVREDEVGVRNAQLAS